MSDEGITRVTRDPGTATKPDWSRFEAMSDAQRTTAAIADPDAPPATDEQLARATRRPDVRAIREAMGLSVDAFGARFGLSPVLLRQWEAGTKWPDRPAQMLLRVIAHEPDAVARVVAG